MRLIHSGTTFSMKGGIFMPQNKPKITEAAKNRKNEIIEGAMKLFAQNGYYSTSLNDVAGRIGVTKATLYYYFRSKEEILGAVLERSKGRMDRVLELGKSALSSRDKLRQIIQYHVLYSSDGAELAKVTFDQTSAFPKRIKTPLVRKEKKIDAFLQEVLEQGIADGTFAIRDVKVASYAILGLCHWIYHWYKPEGRLSPEQISDICIDLLENGYLRRTDRPGE
jgi:AcrR family transcriptional regulator